jgi:hypothetical protein
MTIKEAVQRWLNEFSLIPTELVKRAYKDNPEDLELLSSEYPVHYFPCAHGWMYHPDFSLDEEWIRENIEKVETCGFLVFETDETGILLGVDGGGYSFVDEHWHPLYLVRELKWHDEKEEEEK